MASRRTQPHIRRLHPYRLSAYRYTPIRSAYTNQTASSRRFASNYPRDHPCSDRRSDCYTRAVRDTHSVSCPNRDRNTRTNGHAVPRSDRDLDPRTVRNANTRTNRDADSCAYRDRHARTNLDPNACSDSYSDA